MSKIFVKSTKDTRKGKRVILPCGLVEFDNECIAEITLDQLDQFGDELEAHSLEVVEGFEELDDDGKKKDDDDDDDSKTPVSRNSLNKLNLDELHNFAQECGLPEDDWQELGVTKLRDYLHGKLNE